MQKQKLGLSEYFLNRNEYLWFKEVSMKINQRIIPLISVSIFLFSGILFSFRGDEPIIAGKLDFLIGNYQFICSFEGDTKKDSSQVTEKYTLRITKKDELFVYKNGKKQSKYTFSTVEVPLLDEFEYVMFNKKNQFYPLFYKGDSVIINIFPFNYQDNYYRKTKQ